ncbi:MAG: D-alanine--D-alanine ligase [Clostridia bacterium]|nr:D-alanine--D-alanine ligase [Clostridia bacterium]
MDKTTVLILFGGRSSEHEISLRSAATILSNIDSEKYAVVKIGITKKGRWLLTCADAAQIESGEWETLPDNRTAFLPPDAGAGAVLAGNEDGTFEKIKIDIAFPMLHGMYGEDGTVQGLFELADVPYVGCSVTASAVCMDKVCTKMMLADVDINMAKWIHFTYRELKLAFKACLDHTEQKLGYPVFVKPASAGSSIGVSCAKDREELSAALKLAMEYDSKVIVEEKITGRELEVAIIGTKAPFASTCCEIIKGADVYDYDAKYNNDTAQTFAKAKMDMETADDVRMAALKVYSALGCTGMARADFFYDTENNKIIFNEMNTIPGFTNKSMFPQMLEASWGFTITQQIDMLMEDAVEQHKQRSRLKI